MTGSTSLETICGMRPLWRVAVEACIEYAAPRAFLLLVVLIVAVLLIAPTWTLAVILLLAWSAWSLSKEKKGFFTKELDQFFS